MSKSTTSTLEDFIKKYTKSGAKSYSEWLSPAKSGEDEYASELDSAAQEYDRALSHYGRQAEALGKKGLLTSGYAHYLNANAYSEMQKKKQSALKKRLAADEENRRKYSDYLADYQSDSYKMLRNSIQEIAGQDITDEEKAYKYALFYGIPDELATEVSKFATGISGVSGMTARQKSTLINTLAGKGYSRGNLYYFLTALGMSQKEANELADTIYKLSSTKKTTTSSSELTNAVNKTSKK